MRPVTVVFITCAETRHQDRIHLGSVFLREDVAGGRQGVERCPGHE